MKKSVEYRLQNTDIDNVCMEIENLLKKYNSSPREIAKSCLIAEEAMCFYQNAFGTDSVFTVEYSMGLENHITLRFEGEKSDPFQNKEDEFIHALMKMMGESELWQYKHGTNIVEIKVPKKPLSQILQIGIALACAILFTLVALLLFSPETTETIRNTLFSPASSLFIGVLRSAACIMIFTSISMSIVNIGDIRSFRRISRSLFSGLFLFMLLSTVLTFACFIPWVELSLGSGLTASDSFNELIKTILNMIPPNPITPFIEGNAVQVIVLAIFFGVILSLLGERVKAVKNFMNDFNSFITYVIEKINLLLPLLVFVIIEDSVLSNKVSSIVTYKTIVILWAIAIALQFIFNSFFVSVFGKMSIVSYFKKAKTPLMVSLLTSSSVATFPSNIEVCRKEFKIDKRFVDLGIPIGQILFMPCSAAVMIATCVGCASIAGIAVSPSWILTALIVSVILAIATPPTPGAALTVYSLLFTQMGLPAEFFGVTITLGVITDSVVTMLNTFSLHYLLLNMTGKKKLQNK